MIILNYEYPPLGGGAGVVSQKYAEGLVKRGYTVDVVTTWFTGEKQEEDFGKLRIFRVKSRRKKIFQSNPLEMLSYVFHAKKFLNSHLLTNRYNHCIAFFSIPGGILGQYLFKKYKIPYSISTHGHDIPGFFPEQMQYYHFLTRKKISSVWKNATQIFVLSTKMLELAQNFYPEKKYILLPNGCEIGFFHPDFSKKPQIFHILFVGRLVEQKDPFTFLKALKILCENNISFRANIVGDGPLREKIQKYIVNNKLQNAVFMLGWKEKSELKTLYQSSHIQVCSSKAEAMSIAILESLFSGLYILSTPVSGNTDMIEEGKNGEFFEIGDDTTLAQKLAFWAENFGNLDFSLELFEKLKNQFSWENSIQTLDFHIETCKK